MGYHVTESFKVRSRIFIGYVSEWGANEGVILSVDSCCRILYHQSISETFTLTYKCRKIREQLS